MVYQAFLRRNDADGTKDRFVMTAPNADTMDELYRTVRDCKDNVAKIERLGPDFYTWEGPDGSISDHAKDLKIFFTHLPDATVHTYPPILHNEPRADAISGRRFYIRSKSNPNLYWYCPTLAADGPVEASTIGRTRFRIQLVHGDKHSSDEVMVGTDNVYISTGTGDDVFYLKTTKLGLTLSDDEAQHPFSDFRKRFVAAGEAGLGAAEKKKAVVKVVPENQGEVWELVN